MTAKEKANELYNKMKFLAEYNSQPSTVNVMCKKLALICVNEILHVLWHNHEKNSEKMYRYYIDVRQEINKI